VATENRDTAELKLKHWAGTVDQLVRAARHAAGEVAGLVPYPADYDPDDPQRDHSKYGDWSEAEAARKISIVVAEKGGFTARPADLDALSQLSEPTLESVEDITISIGGHVAPSVAIRTGKSWINALSVEIEGFERTWTAGLRHELTDILKPRTRLHFPLLGDPLNAAYVVAPTFWAVAIGLDLLLKSGHKLPEGARIAIGFGAALFWTAAVIGVAASSKQFELLTPSERPRYQRWKAAVLSASGAVVVGLIVAAIWAAITT
jgi:hypothetical protein